MRLDNQVLHDDRPRHRREERILVLVQGVRLQGLGEELLYILLAYVFDDRLYRADAERLLAHELEVLALLAHVDRERDHVHVVVLLDPPDGDRGVQTARVRQHTLFAGHSLPFVRGRALARPGIICTRRARRRGTCRASPRSARRLPRCPSRPVSCRHRTRCRGSHRAQRRRARRLRRARCPTVP